MLQKAMDKTWPTVASALTHAADTSLLMFTWKRNHDDKERVAGSRRHYRTSESKKTVTSLLTFNAGRWASAVEERTGQRPESICSLTYLVNEDQLSKQLYSHSEGERERLERERRGGGNIERKFFFLCFVFSLPFLHKEEVEEEYQPGPPVTSFQSLTELQPLPLRGELQQLVHLQLQRNELGWVRPVLGTDCRKSEPKKGTFHWAASVMNPGEPAHLPPLSFHLHTPPPPWASIIELQLNEAERAREHLSGAHTRTCTHFCLTRVLLQIHSQRLDWWLEEMSETFYFHVSPQTSAEFTRHSVLFVYWVSAIWTGLISKIIT